MKKLFLAAGIPAFLGTTLLELFLYRDVVAAFLVGSLAFLLIGFCLSLLSLGFTRSPRSKWGITILHYLLIPILSIILTVLFLIPADDIPVGYWQEIQSPPEEIDHFIRTDQPFHIGVSLFVQAKSGKVYSYDCIGYRDSPGCGWELAADPYVDEAYCGNPENVQPDTHLIPLFPGKVIEQVHTICNDFEFTQYVTYIRLRNGRIYYWGRQANPMAYIYFIVGFALVGLIVGLSTSIAIYSLRPPRKTPKTPQSEVIEPREIQDSANLS
jgi:hypothetical protein